MDALLAARSHAVASVYKQLQSVLTCRMTGTTAAVTWCGVADRLSPFLPSLKAKDALDHPYFDDLDKATIDLLESEAIRARDLLPAY